MLCDWFTFISFEDLESAIYAADHQNDAVKEEPAAEYQDIDVNEVQVATFQDIDIKEEPAAEYQDIDVKEEPLVDVSFDDMICELDDTQRSFIINWYSSWHIISS